MEQIKAYVDYNDVNKTHYYKYFNVRKVLPKIGDEICGDKVLSIKEIELDCEQPNDEVFDYDYFVVTLQYEGSFSTYDWFVCVERS